MHSRKLITSVLVCAGILGTMAFVPATSLACSNSKPRPTVTVVTGTVTYKQGHKIQLVQGAIVMVVCNGITEYTTTNARGVYQVQFPKGKAPKGSTVKVVATKGSLTGNASAIVTSAGKNKCGCAQVNVLVINVRMVPEFGGIAAMGALVIGAGAFLVIRRRQLAAH